MICSPPLLFAATGFNIRDLVLNSLFQETSAFTLPWDIFAQLDSPCSGILRVFPIYKIQPSVPSSLLELLDFLIQNEDFPRSQVSLQPPTQKAI